MLLLTYDLVSPNDESSDYKRVMDGIKKLYPSHVHNELSVWILKTSDTAEEGYDKTKSLFKDTDRHLVVLMAKNGWKASGKYGITKTLG